MDLDGDRGIGGLLHVLRLLAAAHFGHDPGDLVDRAKFEEENRRVVAEGGTPASGRPVLMGITKASLAVESWLSAASFQETTRVLTDAAIHGKSDHLRGLKENIIIGHLIPAGTGMYRYQEVDVESDALPEPEPIPAAIEPSFEPLLPPVFAEPVSFTMGDEPL